MGKVTIGIVMSLDGFVAGLNDDIQHLFKWYFGGDVEIPVGAYTLKVSPESAVLLKDAMFSTGAMITGKKNYSGANAWGGQPPFEPCFVVTHHVDQEWSKAGSPFVFVTDGVESAIRQAKQAAGDKDVVIATPSVIQQALKLGLLDEIHVDLAPVLLGSGTRLFEYLGIEPVELEIVQVINAPGVTHLTYRVCK